MNFIYPRKEAVVTNACDFSSVLLFTETNFTKSSYTFLLGFNFRVTMDANGFLALPIHKVVYFRYNKISRGASWPVIISTNKILPFPLAASLSIARKVIVAIRTYVYPAAQMKLLTQV